MTKNPNSVLNSFLNEIIDKFEKEIIERKNTTQNLGIIYTPQNIADFIVENVISLYISEFLKDKQLIQNNLTFIQLHSKLNLFPKKLRMVLIESLKNIKILDPACGSGIFLVATCKILYEFYKRLELVNDEHEIKQFIIENNIYGIEIENNASEISKLKLINWLYSSKGNINSNHIDLHKYNLKNINILIQSFNIKLNIHTIDYLLEFNSRDFDIILGNPPYVENKKIFDKNYKKELKSKYRSAYRLFDISILFIEKSLKILNSNGCISFLTTNKFLSAEYGLRIRDILLRNVEIKEIINLSSIPIFHRTSVYPVILTLKKQIPNYSNKIKITNLKSINEIVKQKMSNLSYKYINQIDIQNLPGKVIPLSHNITVVNELYKKLKQFSEVFNDLEIIYRPFGFIHWVNSFENVSKEKKSDKDLLLIGTGNVAKYYLKFEKRIKLAKKNISISYFNYKREFSDIWKKLQGEKLIYREIAQELTWLYDPGNFVNITGLYFVRIPSLSTENLFSLLAIFNSKLMNLVFSTLFSTLHMSGGYMRFNGIFIKRLPMINNLNKPLARLGMILQFLNQFKYEIQTMGNSELLKYFKNENVEKQLIFYENLSNSLVYQLFLPKESNHLFNKIMKSEDCIPSIKFKFFDNFYTNLEDNTYTNEEITKNLREINKSYLELNKSLKLIK